MKIIILILILIFINLLQSSTLLPEEKEIIVQMLEKNGLQLSDLNFLKDWSDDTKFKLPIVLEILQEPLRFPIFIDTIRSVAQTKDETEFLSFFSKLLFNYDNTLSPIERFRGLADKISVEKDIFTYVESVWDEVAIDYEKAFNKLSDEDWEKLTYFAYSVYSEKEDSLAYRNFYEKNAITQFDDLELHTIAPIIESIDFSAFMRAAFQFQVGFSILKEAIPQNNFKWKKRIEKKTKWGTFCIGTSENDIYTKNYAFLLEPGGNDSYFAKIHTTREQPFYWIWDMKGNDTYQNEEIAGFFSVFFGLGIHEDSEGADSYQGGDYSFSAIFGYQQHVDRGGNDTYISGLHSLGAGSFGISLLVNHSGNNFYSTTQFGQGFGGVLGVGMLLDAMGNDIYFAGGKYRHAPLVPNDYRSLGQGFGFGLRPDFAGGIGILYDMEGNDYYNGGVYAQGSAYWYALGILIDESGNDFYNAVYYPQGSGIHLAGGFLFDGEGDDHYYSKHGPGQGAGHDYGVGFLIDRAGNDIYSIEGGNGLGLTNSVGIFIDVSGNDRYERNFASNYGYANQARDAGGIGLFLDLAGDDVYPMEYTKNNSSWQRGTFGIGLDTLFTYTEELFDEESGEPVAEVDFFAEIDELFSIAAEWAVGDNRKRVEQARKFLLEREEEAATFIFLEKLGTKSGLTYRAIEDFSKKSEAFTPMLKKALQHSDSLYVKNAISLLAEVKDKSAISNFKTFLEQGQYVSTILSALGNFAIEESVSILKDYIDSESERLRVITARSLKKINTPESREYLLQMKDDSSFLIKSMIRIWENRNGTE